MGKVLRFSGYYQKKVDFQVCRVRRDAKNPVKVSVFFFGKLIVASGAVEIVLNKHDRVLVVFPGKEQARCLEKRG